MTTPEQSYTDRATSAIVDAIREEHDFSGWLGQILATAAAELGSSAALTAGRPGSWEANLVQQLVRGTVGWGDDCLADYAKGASLMNRSEHPNPQFQVITLVGNLTADPCSGPSTGTARSATCALAVNDQNDQPPLFIDVAAFGAQADACARYLTKGRAVAVTGRLVYREWDDNGTRRSRHHIIGRVQFGGKPDEPAAETQDATEEVATF